MLRSRPRSMLKRRLKNAAACDTQSAAPRGNRVSLRTKRCSSRVPAEPSPHDVKSVSLEVVRDEPPRRNPWRPNGTDRRGVRRAEMQARRSTRDRRRERPPRLVTTTATVTPRHPFERPRYTPLIRIGSHPPWALSANGQSLALQRLPRQMTQRHPGTFSPASSRTCSA